MRAMAKLRPHVDAFFDKVTVNVADGADKEKLRENRLRLLNGIHRRVGRKELCLAGGVALNCAANGKIFEKTPFRDVYIQAAANDAGTSIGAGPPPSDLAAHLDALESNA